VYSEAAGEAITRRFGAAPRVLARLLGTFSAIALLLGAVGIYGVTAFAVRRRLREIGIRRAVGARRATVVREQVVRGVLPALAGVGIGILIAGAAGRLFSGMLYGVTPTDPTTFAAAGLLLTAVSLGATLVPALGAARVDPAITIRRE